MAIEQQRPSGNGLLVSAILRAAQFMVLKVSSAPLSFPTFPHELQRLRKLSDRPQTIPTGQADSSAARILLYLDQRGTHLQHSGLFLANWIPLEAH
jgi:hypothetical protein